jgi:AcrR family transcriptional regulator
VTVPVEPESRPLRADAERNRRRLLEAAGELFAAKGLGVGLDEIARHAGVGVGTAYRRFRDKDALLEALFRDRVAAVEALAERALADPDPWSGLVTFMEGSVRMQVADRGLKEAFFRSDHAIGCLEEGRTRITPLVEALVARAKESGDLRGDVEYTDIPLVHFLISGVADFAGPASEQLGARYLQIMLDGLRTRDPSPLPGAALSRAELDVAVLGRR